MSKILFVISSYIQGATSANVRNISLIEGLCSNGHIVDVLSREPDTGTTLCDETVKLPPVRQYIYVLKRTQKTVSNNTDIQGTLKHNLLLAAKNIFSTFSIWDTWFVKVRRLRRIELDDYYDVMISSSDPKSSHYLANKILKQNKSKIGKWIQYWGDPFALDINQSSGSAFRVKFAEKKLLRNADKVVYVSPFTLDKQRELYPMYAEKMHFLPIPVRAKQLSDNQKIDNSRLKIGYFGAYKKRDRDIIPLYEAVNQTNHHLEIVGPSDVILASTEHVKVHEQVRMPVAYIEEREKETDVLVCICNRCGTQIPGKAYHYAMTNKYVLIVLDGEYAEKIKEHFSEYNRYLFCKNKVDSIVATLNNIDSSPSLHMPCSAFEPKAISEEFIK